MSLRRRLVLAVVLMTVSLVVGVAYIAQRQQALRLDQLDDQLVAVGANIERAVAAFEANPDARLGQAGTPAIGELYLAIVAPNAPTRVIARPASQPDLEPVIDGVDLAQLTGPVTVDVVGADGDARALAISAGPQRFAVMAISTATIEAANRQLLATAGAALGFVLASFALVLWWVDRLGIQPIVAVTAAAEEVARGADEHRVVHDAPTTEAGRLGAAFNAMLDARQAAEARQHRFVADASHELRSPITTLRGYAALHANGGLATTAEVDDAMRRIGGEAERMGSLVDDLLVLASLDESRPLDATPVNLTELLTDIATDARATQPGRDVHSDGIVSQLVVEADLHRLTQCLTTIVTNTLRHTPETAVLAITAERDGERIRIAIADTGPGIDPSHLGHIFDRFYRGDAGRTRSDGGAGLGLSIAQAVIHAHGGTISAQSTPSEGTTVTIELPSSPLI
ncbi:MAG: two-component system OmpR family sensor kinase [Candidatus Aldehydirespiratoraceae bacterium]|jgi:two-component system OmpR family sensor kinase